MDTSPEHSPVLPLGAADVGDAVALSASAHWNQNADDWRTMLALGRGWGLRARLADGTQPLVASTLVLPYGPAASASESAPPGTPGSRFAWVSMVLVRQEFRRLGLATRLLREALAYLREQGLPAVLDATPAGHDVYAREGFRDSWGFARYRRAARPAPPLLRPPAGITLRPLHYGHWPALQALYAPAFGADRTPLLRALAQRRPQAALVAAAADGRLCGHVFARDGREAGQIGPLLAADDTVALALLQAALSSLVAPSEQPGGVYVDLCDHRQALLPALQALGFEFQRPFTRMVKGSGSGSGDDDDSAAPARAPGDPAALLLVAGPELG